MRKPKGKPLTTRTDPRWCPKCFQLLDACTSMLDSVRPTPGDCTICINCASVLRFTEMMDLELYSLEQIPTHSRLEFARLVQLVKMKPKSPGPTRIC